MARRTPVKLQDSQSECGAACLAMVLGYFGVHVRSSELGAQLNIGRDGANAGDIVALARDFYGLTTRSYKSDIRNLESFELPAILHWGFGHYVVLEKVVGDTFYIIDPAAGRRRSDRAEMGRCFTGVVLTFAVDEKWSPPKIESESTLNYLRAQLPVGRGLLVPFLIVSTVVLILGAIPALFMRYMVDMATMGGSLTPMGHLFWAMVTLIICHAVSVYARGAILVRLRAKIDISLMTNLMGKIFRLPLGYFQNRGAGDILTRTSSTVAAREALGVHFATLVLDLFAGIIYVILLIWIFPLFGLMALVVMLCQLLVAFLFTPIIRMQSERKVSAFSLSQSSLAESINGISSIKASGGEAYAYRRWENHFSRQMLATVREERLQNLLTAFFEVSRVGVPLMLLLVGVAAVLEGSVGLGTMVAANGLVGMAMAPISSISQVYQSLQTVGVHVSRIQGISHEEVERRGDSFKKISDLKPNISFREVDFGYQGVGAPILKNISLDIPSGSSLAIVGPTGCGKSTLGQLALALHLPKAGSLKFDGVDINELDVVELRKQFGAVLQDCAVYSGTIFENIALNSPDATIAEVASAARSACLESDIMSMPMGYETPLGEGGSGISGGQRQRLALARALIAEPRMILLDEATSHLDVATEKRIQENLKNLGCTRIIIAHRLSTVEDADQIVVMNQGAVVEMGDHEDLMQRGGHYFSLVSDARPIGSPG